MSLPQPKADKGNTVLRQSNALTTAAYSLSRSEKRVVYLALHHCLNKKIDFEKAQWGEVPVDISTSDYAREFSCENASKELRAAAESMSKREVIFYEPDEDSGDEKALTAMSWINGRAHRPKRGLITFNFNAKLLKVIFSIKTDFTKYLISAGELKSPYSMRLYESLMQYNSLKKAHFSVDWIIERYELPQSYTRLSDFRRRFLKPSVADIVDCTNIYDLEYEEIKKAGQHFLVFTWKSDDDSQPARKELTPLEQAKVIHSKIVASEEVTKQELKILRDNLTELVISGEPICDDARMLLSGV